MNLRFLTLLLALQPYLPTNSLAAPGDLDLSFNTTGKVSTPVAAGNNALGQSVALQSDGKILVAGQSDNGTVTAFTLVRYTAGGLLDSTFGTGGTVTIAFGGTDDRGTSVAVQGDGKILIAGYASISGGYRFAMARCNQNGILDTTFGTAGKVTTQLYNESFDDQAYCLVVQADGKIVLAGRSNAGSGIYQFGLVRYHPNGTLDLTFNGTGKVLTAIGTLQDVAFSVTAQSDGKLLAAGASGTGGGRTAFALVRYSAIGVLDPGFGTGGKVTTVFNGISDSARSVTVQSDEQILVAGTILAGPAYLIALARYNQANGILDPSFGTGGKVTTDIASSLVNKGNSVAVQKNGKILVAGSSSPAPFTHDFALVRYLANGNLDTTFNGSGKVTTDLGGTGDSAQSIALQNDGKIVLAGVTDNGLGNYEIGLARYQGDILATVTTLAATSIIATGATLNGLVNANGGSASVFFEYLPANANGSNATAIPSPVTGSTDTPVSVTLTGLTPDTDYQFRVNGATDAGTSSGAWLTFQTPNNNADLANLILSSGTLTPTFFKDTTAYTVSVPNTTSTVTVTPTMADSTYVPAPPQFTPRGTIRVNGVVATSFNSVSAPIYLDVGSNLITIIVTAQDGTTTKTYTVTVTRPPSSNADLSNLTVSSGVFSPGFASAITSYTAGVPYLFNTPVSVTPTRADPTATVTVNGLIMVAGGGTVPAPLVVGLNVFTTLVTAQDGITTKTYTLTVTRTNPPPGSLDVDFNAGGPRPGTLIGPPPATTSNSESGRGVAFQNDGKILVAGTVIHNLSYHAFKLARYNANGTLDTAGFGGGTGMVITAPGADDYGYSVAVQRDGKILVAGQSSGNFAVVRYATDGTLDPSFNSTGTVPGIVTTSLSDAGDGAYSVAVQTDGKIVLAGYSGVSGTHLRKFAVARYNSNGTLDPTFNPTGSLPGTVSTAVGTNSSLLFDDGRSVAVQPDGKIVVGGTSYNGTYDYAVVRYNPDGTLDPTFNGTGKVTTDHLGQQNYGHSLALQKDGKILLAGGSDNGDYFQVLRYNSNGSVDTGFGAGGNGFVTSSISGTARSVAVQRDQKILIGGENATGYSRGNFTLLRYKTDGTPDTTFNSAGTPGYFITPNFGGISDHGHSVAVHGDGRIVLAGDTSVGLANYAEGTAFSLARYNAGAEILVEQPTGNRLTDAVSNVNLGTTFLGGTSDRTFTIRSVGTADLTGLALTLSGPDSISFTVTTPAVVPVPPAGSTTFTVRFQPTTAGTKTAVLHIAGNTPDEAPFDINLTGETDALVQPSPAPAPVNNLQTGLPQQMVSVNNSGSRALGGIQLSVSGVPVGVTVAGGTYVAASDTWLVDYNFLLTAGQTRMATLNYSSSLGTVTPTIVIVPPPAIPTTPDPAFATATTPPVLDAATGNAALLLRSQPGRTYQVEYSTDGLKTWLPLTGAVLSRSGQILFSDDGTTTGTKPRTAAHRFYRVTDIAP